MILKDFLVSGVWPVFDIQKSDELFISNITFGIQSIGKFRKKDFAVTVTNIIRNKLCLLVV